MKNMQCISVIITVPDKKTADKITDYIVKEKLAACVNIVSGIKSVYWWHGRICGKKEYLLICKTKASKFKILKSEIEKMHPYEVPEIVCYKISDGNKDYINWILENVK